MGKNICLSVQNIKITHLSFTTISITRKRTNVQRPNLIIKPKIKNNFVDAENEKRCILSTLRNYALTTPQPRALNLVKVWWVLVFLLVFSLVIIQFVVAV